MTQQMVWMGLRRLGLPGLLGLGLLLLAAWVHWGWLPVQQAQLDAVASDVRYLRHDLQASLGNVPANKSAEAKPWDLSGLSPQAAWQTVWDTLPDASQRMSLLTSVSASAQKLGVNVASIQYRGAIEPWSVHQDQALWRQRMTMPVEGRYGDVRAWLGTLLNQSCLSLDTLDIARSDTTSDHVKGRVSLSLWWRTHQGPQP